MKLSDPKPEWMEKTFPTTEGQQKIIQYTMQHPWQTQTEVAEQFDTAQSHVGRVLRREGKEFVDTLNTVSDHTNKMMDPVEVHGASLEHAKRPAKDTDTENVEGNDTSTRSAGEGSSESGGMADLLEKTEDGQMKFN